MKDGNYAIVPVTIENGEPLSYKEDKWGKGRQLEIDAADFPTLAATGLHSEAELNRAKMIAGRSIVEITSCVMASMKDTPTTEQIRSQLPSSSGSAVSNKSKRHLRAGCTKH